MKSRPALHFSSGTLVIIMLALLVLGGLLFYFIQASLKEFRQEEISKHMTWMGNSVTYFCNANYDELARVGDLKNRTQSLLKKAETIQAVEDFVRNNEFEIIIIDTSRRDPAVILASIPGESDNIVRLADLPLYEVRNVFIGNKQYASFSLPFESWNWKISLFKDSSSYDILLSRLNIFYLAFGVLIGMLCFVIVLFFNQHLKAENALRQSEIDLKATLDSLAEGVMTVNEDGLVEQINPAALAITGWQREKSPVGFHVSGILDIKTERGEQDILPDDFEKGGSERLLANHAGEFRLKTGEGIQRLVQIRFAGKQHPARNIPDKSLVISFHDITEHKAIEDQLRQVQKMESVGQLAGGVAHDFNNMLGGILGMAELLSQRLANDEKLSNYVRVIVETTHRASALTDKLLAFSRKGKVLSKAVDVNNLIGDVITILERSIDPRIRITRNIDGGKPVVTGDPGQLQNAILNLAINARDAMPEGGELTIGSACIELDRDACKRCITEIKPGRYVDLFVVDSGHGIPQELVSKIFEPFFTTKEVGRGTGLGLAAVYGTVSEHNGSIYVNSEENRGTEFHIYLPMNLESSPEEFAADREEKQTVDSHKTILLVDDEPMIRDMAQALLEEIGYKVICVEDGHQAIKTYGENPLEIDLVLLDMVMPVMNGAECFKALKEIDPDIMVILTSGFTQDSSLPDLESGGLAGFLKKPYSFSELRMAVTSVLER